MKKWLWPGLVVIVLAACLLAGITTLGSEKGQVCLNKHLDNFVGCYLAGPVALSVQVTGNVDQVSFYKRVNDGMLVATIATNGRDTTETIYLPTYYSYYFVVQKGDQTFSSKPVGFDSNQQNAKLNIRGLDQWEGW